MPNDGKPPAASVLRFLAERGRHSPRLWDNKRQTERTIRVHY